jgi:hypothetical protein
LDKVTKNIAKALQTESESQKQFDDIHVICGGVGKTHYYKNKDLNLFKKIEYVKKKEKKRYR